jgi:hypothetical protein
VDTHSTSPPGGVRVTLAAVRSSSTKFSMSAAKDEAWAGRPRPGTHRRLRGFKRAPTKLLVLGDLQDHSDNRVLQILRLIIRKYLSLVSHRGHHKNILNNASQRRELTRNSAIDWIFHITGSISKRRMRHRATKPSTASSCYSPSNPTQSRIDIHLLLGRKASDLRVGIATMRSDRPTRHPLLRRSNTSQPPRRKRLTQAGMFRTRRSSAHMAFCDGAWLPPPETSLRPGGDAAVATPSRNRKWNAVTSTVPPACTRSYLRGRGTRVTGGLEVGRRL